MIKYLILGLIFLSSILFAQSEISVIDNSYLVEIKKNDPSFTDSLSGNFTIRDYYNFTDPGNAGTFKLPYQIIFLAIPANETITVSSVSYNKKIINKTIPALNPSVVRFDSGLIYKEYDYENVSGFEAIKELIEIKGYFRLRDFYIVQIKINNYQYNVQNSSLEIFENITFRINFANRIILNPQANLILKDQYDLHIKDLLLNNETAEQFRNSSNISLSDTTGNWIDYNSTYLKFGTANDGIFRLTRSDLQNQGVPVNTIDPRTFKIFESGQEIKIYVNGEDDGNFDDSDYIEINGSKNYPEISHRVLNEDDEEYNEYLNRYTDTTNYFLTWGGNVGKRSYITSSSLTGITDTLNYYLDFKHYEIQSYIQFCDGNEIANQTPNWLKNKTWYWKFLLTQQTYNFVLNDIYPNKQVSVFSKIASWASNFVINAHQATFSVNNIQIDSISIDRFNQALLSGNINSSNLIEGSNQFKLINIPNGSFPNALIVDWYEIEYPRYLYLENDSLRFKVADDVVAGVKILKLGNATQTSYRIYKLKPQFKIVENYLVSNGNLFFADTVSASDVYYVISGERSLSPKYYYLKNFINIRNNSDQTDYIAVTHPIFEAGVQNYLQQVSNLYDLSYSLYKTEDIFDEFSYGYPHPESIKSFANAVYNNAQSPKPAYLSLIGDANYDYKYFLGTSGGKNYVPAYGNPVSDNWFAVWDSVGPPIPQLKVGRIPINSVNELDYYFSKLEKNETSLFDEWNKRYLLFSGGRADIPNELERLKAANDSVVVNLIEPIPISGNYTHFYKTRNPPSDFGPYTPQQIQTAISNGGVFISYIGHSGTATWDNSINSTNQLYNSVNRNPLITDFGCSTNKYAEPNIVCFGERFLFNSTGQALGYIGNSSLGFESVALTVPRLYYEGVFIDSLNEVGNAHLYSKIELFNQSGNTSVNRIYALTNVILGDPAARLKIPFLPNFKITNSDIIVPGNQITEIEDSVEFKVALKNLGLSQTGQLEIKFQQIFQKTTIKEELKNISIPFYSDTLTVWLQTKDKPGLHSLVVDIDPQNLIDEIYEDDNIIEYQFNIFSSSVRDLLTSINENSALNELLLLNPSNYSSDSLSIELQISEEPDFINPVIITTDADSFSTTVNLSQLQNEKRYFIRYRINSSGKTFSGIKSFYNSDDPKYLLIDSLSFNSLEMQNVGYKSDSLLLLDDTTHISVLSAGFYSGATCVIAKDGVNQLTNTFFSGMGIVVFDEVTLEVDTSAWFQLFNQPANVEALANMIDSIPHGKIVAMGVASDAANNMSSHLRNSIKTIGSSKIDSLQFRGSWAIIGWKGAPIGSVLEDIKPPLPAESVFLDTSYIILSDSGSFNTQLIGPAKKWDFLELEQELPGNSETHFVLFGKTEQGNIDSIRTIEFTGEISDISDVKAEEYPELFVKGKLKSSEFRESPKITKLAVDFISVAELGTNYQVVSTSADTIYQGDSIYFYLDIYNVGEVNADSFYLSVELIKPDNNPKHLYDTLITILDPLSSIHKDIKYNAILSDGFGNMKFIISIDTASSVKEFYKDNNIFEESFYVKEDTVLTSINQTDVTIAFDGIEILNGDFVNPNPEILISVHYPLWFTYQDTSQILFLLDGSEQNYSDIIISFDTVNRIGSYLLKPNLSDGEHFIQIVGRDRYGNLDYSSSIERFFFVESNLNLLDVYNYPNPFSESTHFVFKLTQIPDELKIKIFSVSGRLLKEIIRNGEELNIDFNRIHWDGRDEDGDLVANGVYLVKAIAHRDDESVSSIQKIAIVR